MNRLLTVFSIALLAASCSDDPAKNALTEDGGNNTQSDAGRDMSGDTGSNNTSTNNASNNAATNNTTADMGIPDMPPDGPLRVRCDQTLDEVYATPVSDGENGEVLGCAVSESATAGEVTTRTLSVGGLTITSGYDSYLIAYRTSLANGDTGVSTMLLYVPDTPRNETDSAIIVANHGGVDIPDECAPSKAAQLLSFTNSIALPWAGSGYPVALPDFAGKGTVGVPGVGNTQDLGYSALDAARAARAALPADAANDDVLAVGGAEGGHAAYAMQALASNYAPEINFVAAIGFATSYPTISYADLLRAGGLFPLVDGIGVTRALTALIAYSNAYHLYGENRAREIFDPALRDYVGNAVETQCSLELVITLATDTAEYTPPAVIAGLIEPTFRTDVVDCLNAVNCTADAQVFVDRAAANVAPLDANGGDLLFISALDGSRPNVQDQTCLLEWIEQNGPVPDRCLWSGANNVNITNQAGSYALDWGIAKLEGTTVPDCPQNAFPSCQ